MWDVASDVSSDDTCHARASAHGGDGVIESPQAGDEGGVVLVDEVVFTEIFNLLAARRPSMFLAEEVPGFDHKVKFSDRTSLQTFMEMAALLGFAVRAVKDDAAVWAKWPRPRWYITGVQSDAGGAKAADWVMAAAEEMTSYREINEPTELVPHIISMDAAAIARRRKQEVDVAQGEAGFTSQAMFREWRKHSAVMRRKGQLSASYNEWARRTGTKLVGCPKPERVKDLLDTAWGFRIQGPGAAGNVCSAELARGCWANVSQVVQRFPFGSPGALTTTSLCYSFQHDCCLGAEDHLRLQGIPCFYRRLHYGRKRGAEARRRGT